MSEPFDAAKAKEALNYSRLNNLDWATTADIADAALTEIERLKENERSGRLRNHEIAYNEIAALRATVKRLELHLEGIANIAKTHDGHSVDWSAVLRLAESALAEGDK